ncbi:3'-5' exonuclease [Sharpea azabuensis]|uniref:3'-5' exonuclease n=1 Tax=Sharpea porci TaxID=2652286 RepID=A0A844FU35_9FIRM|nr:3'-5' exonuclease [Sharpea porci]MST88942.1 3'-5' exonuclease [Sharpea porci]
MLLKEMNSYYKFHKERLKQWLIENKYLDQDYDGDIYDLVFDSSFMNVLEENKAMIKTTPIRKKYQNIDQYEPPYMIPMTYSILDLDDCVILDTETTGLYKDDEVIELSVIDMLGNEIYHSLYHPQKRIGQAASRVNGITNPMLKDEPYFVNEWEAIKEAVGHRRIIGHNIAFDYRITLSTALRYHIPESEVKMLFRNMVDSRLIAKRYIKNVDNYKLSTLCEMFGITDPQKHRATYDCLMTLEFLRALESYLLNNDQYNGYRKERKNMPDLEQAILYGYKAGKSIEDLSIFYGISRLDIAKMVKEHHLEIHVDPEVRQKLEILQQAYSDQDDELLIQFCLKYASREDIYLILGK